MKETIIAIIALALIMGGIWFGLSMNFYKPVLTETKSGIILTIPKR